MVYEGDAASRRSQWSGGTSISNDNLVSSTRLLLLQRRLKRAKRNTAANTQQQQQKPPVPRQKKKLDGFLEKTQSKLTISTAETSCTSSLSQSLPANHSFEYQISKMPSQQSFGNDTHGSGSGSMEDSLTDSFATFTMSSQARDAAALFKEWRSIYAVSAENSEHHADDEDDGDDDTTQYDDNTQNDYTTKKDEFHSDETFISHVDEESHTESYAESQAFGQMIIDGTPSDLLSGQYTVESSTDEMNPPNQHIPTPPETTRTSCSINFDFFGGNDILKSVVERMSRMASTGKNEDGVNDDNSEYSNDSSCSEKSDSSGETNNFIPNELLHFDGGVTQATTTTNWTFDSSEGGTVDSEL